MKKILFLILMLASASSFAIGASVTSPAIPYCASGNTLSGYFIPTANTAFSYNGSNQVLTITYSDGVSTYVTTLTYSGTNVATVSCAIKQ
jgi:hypothetical protein